MRRRRQEQPVLEALGELSDGLGELAVDRVARPAGRCGVVRLVKDQQCPWPKCAEMIPQPGDIGFFGQEVVRDDEARAGRPWIDREAA